MKNVFLVFALFLAVFTTGYAAGLPSDIQGSKYKNAILFLYEEGIVQGYDDGTFRPNYELNRAELVKFVTGTKGQNLDPVKYRNCFPDVREEWYAKYICYAKSEGWVAGYPDGLFRPGNKVNKAEAVKIAVNAFRVKEEGDGDVPFTDIKEGDWYFVYVRAAYQNDLLEEKHGKYNPGANMTRGQISEIVYRVLSPESIVEDGSNDVQIAGERRRLDNDDLVYLGAFRLPEGGGKSSFGYGGWAMAINPHGDSEADGFPGSLYVSGHDYQQMVAEVTIPVPKDQREVGVEGLNSAKFLQDFEDITEGMAASTDEGNGYRLDGLAYLDPQGSQSEGKLYWTARTYYNVDTSDDLTHGVSDIDFDNPNAKGLWRLGNFHSSMTSGYIFTVPEYFADAYLEGKRLISGLFTQQGVSATSQGPAFFAYAPWQDALDGIAPGAGAVLEAIALTYYPYALPPHAPGVEPEPISNFPDYQVPDHWEAAAWVNTDEAHAVIVTGRRAMGETYYGDARPTDCDIYKGYHGEPYEPRFLFYDPSDLAEVAEGVKEPDEVLPYLEWDPSDYLVPSCDWELMGAVYDEANHLFYVMQFNADNVGGDPKPLIYVFRIED